MIKKPMFSVSMMLVIYLLTNILLFSEGKNALPDIMNPQKICADNDHLYILDNACNCVFIYSLKNFKLIGKFGKTGEGPGETVNILDLNVYPDVLRIHSMRKLVTYSKTGKFIKETILRFSLPAMDIEIAGNNILALQCIPTLENGNMAKTHYEVSIYDQNLEKIKKIATFRERKLDTGKKQEMFLVNPVKRFQTYSNLIFLANGDNGFNIEVFDPQGNELRVISKEFPKIKIDEHFKERKLKAFFDRPSMNPRRKAFFKKHVLFRFPEFFPAMQDFIVADDKIHVKTYRSKKDETVEFIVLDLKGNPVKKTYLPNVKLNYYCIDHNLYYYLIENEDDEIWEVHYRKI